MMEVVLCISTGHDPWLVVLAVFVCCIGAFAVAQMFEHTRKTAGLPRIGWVFLTSVAAGATIWCTHFVAMLGFRPGVPVTIDPVLTILSLVVAIVGTGFGFGLATFGAQGIGVRAIGGGVAGAAIAGMHFAGMAAYRVDGVVTWRPAYVGAAVLCSVFFAAASIAVLGSNSGLRRRLTLGTTLLVTAIATLHFVAMTAMRIAPLSLSATALSSAERQALGFATAIVLSLIHI